MAHTANSTGAGWQFTVTGLNQASKYAYTLDALNASQQSIKHYQGEFATDGYTDLETVNGSQFTNSPVHQFTKYVKDGRLLIERNGILYNAHGARVK